jgi:hypothetical protein
MRKWFLISALSLVSVAVNAQVTVVKDSRIDDLVRAQGQIIPPATTQEINGYRLQLTFDSNKSFIDDARSKFAAQFPKVDTYVEFVAPHYFLKVGDFRTQLEAEKVKAATAAQFPTGFVVKEKINLPRIDQ